MGTAYRRSPKGRTVVVPWRQEFEQEQRLEHRDVLAYGGAAQFERRGEIGADQMKKHS